MTREPSIPRIPGSGPPVPSFLERIPGLEDSGTGPKSNTQPPPDDAPPQVHANVQAAVQHGVSAGELTEKPPMFSWIQRNPHNRNIIIVTHRELGPQPVELEISKYTFNVRNQVGRFKGQLLGPMPDPDCEETAELQAVVACGILWRKLDTTPPIDPGEFTDEELMMALYREVNAYWALFRKPQQT